MNKSSSFDSHTSVELGGAQPQELILSMPGGGVSERKRKLNFANFGRIE